MKLEHHISHAIKNFPSLYRCDTYEESRIPVLDHIFLTNGNGLDWHRDGFLASRRFRRTGSPFVIQKTKARWPKDFFQKRLWDVEIHEEKIKDAEKALGDRYFYKRKSEFRGEPIRVVFEGDEDFAQGFVNKYSVRRGSDEKVFLHEAESGYRTGKRLLKDPNTPEIMRRFYERCVEPRPYPVCEYSAIVEMINGRTNSFHIENFDLVNIQQDWIDGATEIVKYAMAFYEDAERCKACSYHPDSPSMASTKRDFSANPKAFRKTYSGKEYETRMTPEMDIDGYMWACWENHRQKQMRYFKKFMKKFA